MKPTLEALVQSRSRLLRAQRLASPRHPGWRLQRLLLLTFDGGRVFAAPADGGRGLLVTLGTESPADELELQSLDEDEPWWALLGAPLCAAQAELGPDGSSVDVLELQFREDDANPRRLRLTRDGDDLRLDSR